MYSPSQKFFTSFEDLKKYISPEEIFHFYYGDFEVNEYYKSPFRDETRPSFVFRYHKGELKYVDFGEKGENYRDAVEFVGKLFNLPYRQALNRIYQEMESVERLSDISIKKYRQKANVPDLNGAVRFRKSWKKEELDYWSQFQLTEKELLFFEVYPCMSVWFNDRKWHQSTPKDPLFLYLFNKVKNSWKVYRPYAAERKDRFRAFNVKDSIQGFNQLPWVNEHVCLTSSLKDVMVLHKLNIPAIALHSENKIPSEELIKGLRKRFKNVFLAYDNDHTGKTMSKAISDTYDLEYWLSPHEDAKDPSDFVLRYSYEELKQSLISQISNYEE